MTTLATDKPRPYEVGDMREYPMIASDIIYEGAAVGLNTSGYARPLEAGDTFVGFAIANVANTGAAGAKRVRVRACGTIQIPVTGASALTDVNSAVYASDDDTFTLTESTNSRIGKVTNWISGTTCNVAFEATASNPADVGALTAAALTENAGVVGGTNDGDLPDLTATYTALTGAGSGTANGALEAEGTLSTAGGNTYSDAAVNTVLAKLENNVMELATVAAALGVDGAALRAAARENAAMINKLVADLATLKTAVNSLL